MNRMDKEYESALQRMELQLQELEINRNTSCCTIPTSPIRRTVDLSGLNVEETPKKHLP
jgi:hypothetical protein